MERIPLLERLEIRRLPADVQEVCLKPFCAVMVIEKSRWSRGWLNTEKT